MPHSVIGTQIDDFRITELVGDGASGWVYGATHTRTQRRAALKLMRRELSANETITARFLKEAQTINGVGHPNIVEVYVEHLRRKLDRPFGREAIETIRGSEYRVEDRWAALRRDDPDDRSWFGRPEPRALPPARGASTPARAPSKVRNPRLARFPPHS